MDILIVDDEADIAENLAELLQRRGMAVRTAENGEAALTLMQDEGAPRFVITDLRMPRMNGFDLVEQARRAFGAQAPAFIVQTGHGAVYDKERAESLGALAVLEKPVRIKQLLALLAI